MPDVAIVVRRRAVQGVGAHAVEGEMFREELGEANPSISCLVVRGDCRNGARGEGRRQGGKRGLWRGRVRAYHQWVLLRLSAEAGWEGRGAVL